ncbi:TonB-dependent receptor [Flagellimonas pacifica]|nr:TonB-dependent receptor plug domain-containing protein [Allomuricauda parva]
MELFTKTISVNLLLLFSICFSAISQQKKSLEDSSIPIIEKVYLHTDRSNYAINEDLWYKVYVTYAYSNTILDHSKVLYVELISPDSKVIARNITRLDQGLGNGDFSLSELDGFKAGTYQLRAYTNWTRNFGKDFIFTKEIKVVDLGATVPNKGVGQQPNLATKQKSFASTDKVDLQFFPEGGSLLAGVTSKIAFKSVDQYGNPIEINGNIFDENGNLLTTFSSLHNGMGIFILNELKPQNLFAEFSIKNDTTKIKKALPKVLEEGYLLGINERKGKYYISLKTNKKTFEKNPREQLTLVASTRGITYFEGSQALQSPNLTFVLPAQDFPEGITQITLYDEAMKPHSERLVYIHKEPSAKVTLSIDKTAYTPKQKVNLTVTSKTTEGQIIPASFSLVVKESNGTNKSLLNSNICSYFLMESDIKGKIFNPGNYFDVSNPKRFAQMDLLLLTQGWRDFLWKSIPEPISKEYYKAEKGIIISGKVKRTGKNNRNQYKINMALTKEGDIFMNDVDALPTGDFIFDPINFNGHASLLLNSQNQKKENAGNLELYPICQDTLAIDHIFFSFTTLDEGNLFKQQLIQKNMNYGVSSGNQLDEVVVTSKRNVEEKKPKTNSIGNADIVRVLDDRTPSFRSLLQLIPYAVPGTVQSGKSIRFSRFNDPALILMDGLQIDSDILGDIVPDDVERIEAITGPGGAVYGQQGGNGVIMIFTKPGARNRAFKKKSYTVSQLVQGFYNARKFYAPNYGDPTTLDFNKRDLRNTIFWEPYVHPNENGTAKLSYYNSEASNSINLVLEGITETGQPIVVRKSYEVNQ